MSTNIALAPLKATATGATTARTFGARFADVLNVKDFGATGDGDTDDSGAIQAAFNAAFGPPGSPHGNTNRFLNKPVYIPSGNYMIGTPLYLINVKGGHIFGDSQMTSQLTYNGALNGNTVNPGSGITPLIMTNGVSYSRFERIGLSIGTTTSTCFYLYEDGAQGQTDQNSFIDMFFSGGTDGVCIGYQASENGGGLCSENVFINCTATGSTWGFVVIDSNALNNQFINCSASNCATAGFYNPTGSMFIYGASMAINGIDIRTGTQPMTVIGSRTESVNFIDTTADNGGRQHFISGCVQANGDHNDAGYFVNLGSANSAILDACVTENATSGTGVISGSSSSKVYLRACKFANTGYLTGFTGTVAQNI